MGSLSFVLWAGLFLFFLWFERLSFLYCICFLACAGICTMKNTPMHAGRGVIFLLFLFHVCFVLLGVRLDALPVISGGVLRAEDIRKDGIKRRSRLNTGPVPFTVLTDPDQKFVENHMSSVLRTCQNQTPTCAITFPIFHPPSTSPHPAGTAMWPILTPHPANDTPVAQQDPNPLTTIPIPGYVRVGITTQFCACNPTC